MITLPGIHDTPSGDKQFRGDFFQINGTDTLWFSLAVIHGNPNRVIDNIVPMVRLFMRFNFFHGTITAKTRRLDGMRNPISFDENLRLPGFQRYLALRV